mgnify:CR=1 FL=1
MDEHFDYDRFRLIWARIEWLAKREKISPDEVYRVLGQVVHKACSPESLPELTLRDVDVDLLLLEVSELSISICTRNALSRLQPRPFILAQLIQLPKETILGCRDGPQVAEELHQILGELGLALGMKLADDLIDALMWKCSQFSGVTFATRGERKTKKKKGEK